MRASVGLCAPQSQRAVTLCAETRLTEQSGLVLLYVPRTNANRVETQLRLADYGLRERRLMRN